MEAIETVELTPEQFAAAYRAQAEGGEGSRFRAGGDPADGLGDDWGEPWVGSFWPDGAMAPASSTNRQGSNRHDVGVDGGEDTADWGWCVEWPELKLLHWRETFTKAQKAAQQNDFREARVVIGGVVYLMRPAGARIGGLYFAWCLEGMGVRMAMMDRDRHWGQTPNVRIHVGSVRLLHEDLRTVHRCMRASIELMGGEIRAEKVSRVDACLDLVDVPVKAFVMPFLTGKVIRRGRNFGVYGGGLEFTGFHVGQEQIRLRIYDKAAECKADPIKWDLLCAHRFGGEIPEVVTRVEFQLRRKVLQEFQVETVADWLEKRAGVLDYLNGKWFRLTDDEVDRENTQRCGPSALWQAVSEGFAKWAGITFAVLERVKLKRRMLDVSALLRQGVGCWTSAAAVLGRGLGTWEAIEDFVADELKAWRVEFEKGVLSRFEQKWVAAEAALCVGG